MDMNLDVDALFLLVDDALLSLSWAEWMPFGNEAHPTENKMLLITLLAYLIRNSKRNKSMTASGCVGHRFKRLSLHLIYGRENGRIRKALTVITISIYISLNGNDQTK